MARLFDAAGNPANTFDVTREAIHEAQRQLEAVDQVAGHMARLLVGRLRRVSPNTLRQLKRELRDFSMTTGKWNR